MFGAFLLIILLFIINQAIYNSYERKFKWVKKKLLNSLYLYHIFFFLVYYLYAQFNRSDSYGYYERPQLLGWLDYFGTSTTFIDFISWPFINVLGFNYEMMMILYAWFGYIGFVYAYLFFRESIPIKIRVFKNIDFLSLVLFLPNMHFWTASLGKGAPIFMGLMIYAYAIHTPKKRWGLLILSSLLIFYIRPHVFLFVAVATVLGYMTGREKISFGRKLLIYAAMIGGLIMAQDSILGIAGLNNSEDLVEGFEEFSDDRAGSLSSSGSGVDMVNYSLPLKLFTFWFRPLFFDAPGILGLIVSAENLIYLLLFLKILRKDFLTFLKNSPITVKMSLTVFFLASLALSFVMSNLGIIMRQKSMVMYFLFFVIYYFLAQKKYNKIMKIKKRRMYLLKKKELELTAS